MMQYYKIADLLVEMSTSGRTKEQAIPYLTTEKATPDITIAISKKTRDHFMQSFTECSSDLAEYMLTGFTFYRELLKFDGMFLHASAIAVDGKAYLFSGDSGAGKSTHRKLWQQCFGDEVTIINDDKPALRFRDGQIWVYGTPWSGSTNENKNICVPLGGICFLQQGTKNEIKPMPISKALHAVVLQTTHFNLNEKQWKLLINTLDRLLRTYRIFSMECTIDKEAALLCRETLQNNSLLKEMK